MLLNQLVNINFSVDYLKTAENMKEHIVSTNSLRVPCRMFEMNPLAIVALKNENNVQCHNGHDNFQSTQPAIGLNAFHQRWLAIVVC